MGFEQKHTHLRGRAEKVARPSSIFSSISSSLPLSISEHPFKRRAAHFYRDDILNVQRTHGRKTGFGGFTAVFNCWQRHHIYVSA